MSQSLKYTVQSGDSLSEIAANINASAGIGYQDIVTANGLADANAIQVGQSLKIPFTDKAGQWIYVVMSGDNLSAIADSINASQGVTWQEIATANNDLDPDSIQVGQVLTIPKEGEQITPTEPVDLPEAEYIGYWDWTYETSQPLVGANIGIAFSGWGNVGDAVSQSAHLKDQLLGEKFLSLGGGDKKTGPFTQAFLQEIEQAITDGTFAGYDGLAYDIEVGESGLADAFAQSFSTAQAHGFKVLVTISHSAPYDIDDAADLMKGFFPDTNIDYMSPQLYTNGKETENDYADPLLSWAAYADCKSKVIPSIVTASMYPDAEQYFAEQGVTTHGYIQWQQV